MLPEIFGFGFSLLVTAFHAAADMPAAPAWPEQLWSLATTNANAAPVFRAQERVVSNWRRETFWNVALPPNAAFQLMLGRDPGGVSRCVRLNNYWCIKKAGWNGEIASDAEGHVAFASALEGAAVAALLLRRYYVDYNRHSAFAIISHWAPAQCGSPIASHHSGGRVKTASALSTIALHDVAPRGIQNTLRARWLAGHGRGGMVKAGKGPPLRRSVIPDRSVRMMPAPEIAVGMGERDIKLKPFELGSFGLNRPLPPMMSCAADAPRIEAYAQRAIAGIVTDSNQDLHLFTADGLPAENLARLMNNMASVEIGPLAARGWLIEAGVATLVHRSAVEKPPSAALSSPPP
jgi:hypothetical protein